MHAVVVRKTQTNRRIATRNGWKGGDGPLVHPQMVIFQMHILLIHQAFTSHDEPGGTRHYELARHIVQKGHRFTIIASNIIYLSGKRASAQKGSVAERDLDGVRILRAYTYPSLHRSFVRRMASLLSFMVTSLLATRRVGPVDVVMGTSPSLFQAASAWLIALLYRRPFLLEIRDLWPEFAIDLGILKNPLLIALSRYLARFLYKRATHLLVNSPAYRDYLVAKGMRKEKVSLIANGVDPDMFPQQKKMGNAFALKGKFVITYTGALGRANDIDTIIRAATRLRNEHRIHFLLVGDGMERHRLEDRVQTLALSNVTFTGAQPKARIPDILASSDACVATLRDIPMFRTTYPNKVFDYMAAGRPTILAIDGVIRQVVEAAKGGLFVRPGDDVSLAESVRFLSQNPLQARTMGKRARAYVVRHFNRHQQARQFAKLVQRVAAEKR